MKRRIVINGPCYKNELSIYQKETLDKVDGFRRARTHWLATADESQKASTKVKEGMNESNIYKGRCSCLRRIGLKTTFLRARYKNFRPERYWTFRKKLTEQEVETYDALERGEITEKPKRQMSRMVCSSSDVWKKGDLETCYRDAAKAKGRLLRKQKRKECKEKEVSGPCKKAIQRLKASKIKDGIIESCKCDDGREVTVVIKGICLCDKTNLGKVNLSKVCDEYTKMQKPPEQPVEGASDNAEKQTKETNASKPNQETEVKTDKYLHVSDSADTYRRRKSLHEMEDKQQNEKDIREEVDDNAKETKRKLTFENEENLKENGGQRRTTNQSDITLFKKLSSDLDTDKDVKPKTEPPVSRLLPVMSPLKPDPVLGGSNPPKSDSLNNLLVVNEDKKTEAKGQLKKYPAKTPDKKPSELVHASNSLEIYKKQWKKHASKHESDKTEETQEDQKESKKREKTPEKKTKVKLSQKTTIIPRKSFPAEETPSPHPETKPPGTPLETHDLVTYPESENENKTDNKVERKASESKSKASVGSRQTAVVNPDTDDNSIVTLYKNEPEPKSEMGLTKEEYERMQEVKREEQSIEKNTAKVSAL